MSISIYQFDAIKNFETIHTLEFHNFPEIISEKSYINNFYFCLALDPENLWVSYKVPDLKNYDSSLALNKFQADLWKRDVCELFLASDSDNQYQEFNFSPSGAYWTVQFSNYRERISETDRPIEGLLIERRITISGICISAKIPKRHLIKNCSLSNNSKLSVCIIAGESPRNYLSTSKLNKDKPDFHTVSNWSLINLLTTV